MKAHRHAWVTCTHDDGPCGLLICIYCRTKRKQYHNPELAGHNTDLGGEQ